MRADTDLLTDKKEVHEKLEDYQGLLVSGEWDRTVTQECGNYLVTFPRISLYSVKAFLVSKLEQGIMRIDGFFVDPPRT